MALDLPESVTVVAKFELVVVLRDGGDKGTVFDLDGMDETEAIGYLTTTLDFLREQQKYGWDRCVVCGQPLSDHDDCDDQEDDDDEL